jgi:chromosome segregation ATPase
MKSSRLIVSVLVIALAACIAAAGGCGSKDKGRERSAKAVGGMKETRSEVAAARKQVDEVLAAATGVQSAQSNLAPAYNTYKKEVAEMEKAAEDTRDRWQDMQARGQEYQAKWRAEMATVGSPELKAAAEARAAKVGQRYAEITAKALEARAAYEPFIKDLKDLQTYLSNDLTPAAVQAAAPAFQRVQASGQSLNQKLDALSHELDAVAAEMSPTGGGAPG